MLLIQEHISVIFKQRNFCLFSDNLLNLQDANSKKVVLIYLCFINQCENQLLSLLLVMVWHGSCLVIRMDMNGCVMLFVRINQQNILEITDKIKCNTNIINIRMGLNASMLGVGVQTELDQFLQKVEYIFQTQTDRFGRFKIYKMLDKPYEYIMRKDYTEIVDRKNIDKKKSEYKNNALLKNKNLINFDFIYLTEVQQKCNKYLRLSLFCRYYYFTLEEIIVKKLVKNKKFQLDQIIYLAKTLISIYEDYHQLQHQQCQLFRTSSLFLTPEGFIKVYPFLNEWSKETTEKQQSRKSSKGFLPFSTPHEIELDLNKEKKDLHNKHYNDITDIGITLLSMICLAEEKDYRTGQGNIKEGIVNFVLNSYNETENKHLQVFRNLLKGMVENSFQMPRIKQQLQWIQSSCNGKNVTRIKIIGGDNDNDDSQKTMNEEQKDRFKESRLKNLPTNHLVPRKIRCFSVNSTN